MTDTRIRASFDKPIDLALLDQELGGHGLSASDSEVVVVEGSPVTEAELIAAIAAHVAPNPNAAREAALAKLAALGLTVDDLAALGL